VAPLKDAAKKGIPPGARWTKINRRLVSPEALEDGHERFEERLDYVVVLRVLTREEIELYADKTQEIRSKYSRGRLFSLSPLQILSLLLLYVAPPPWTFLDSVTSVTLVQ
jgi:hypothetical protein